MQKPNPWIQFAIEVPVDGVQVEISLPQDRGQAGKVQQATWWRCSPASSCTPTRRPAIRSPAQNWSRRRPQSPSCQGRVERSLHRRAPQLPGRIAQGSGGRALRSLWSPVAGQSWNLLDPAFRHHLRAIPDPAHWPLLYALDLDSRRVSAVWAACDPDSTTLYLES